jgi:acyl-CoA thioesterase-1
MSFRRIWSLKAGLSLWLSAALLVSCQRPDPEPTQLGRDAEVPRSAEPVSAAATTAPGDERTLLILGDSLTAGFGLDPALAYPALLEARLREAGYPFRVINAGVSGDTSSSGRRRLAWLLRQPVEVLVLALGGNDGLRGIPTATLQDNLRSILEDAQKVHPLMLRILAGMQAPPNMGKDYAEAFQQVFPAVAKACQVALVPFLLEGVGGKPQFNQRDGIHPNAEGQKILADNVWQVLEPALKEHLDPP